MPLPLKTEGSKSAGLKVEEAGEWLTNLDWPGPSECPDSEEGAESPCFPPLPAFPPL